ncbi:SURF1 family protein [Polynucleobacter sp. UB-Tiil-W10]|uniref:SURF1 family protein n=1 Tax=Polynucleobacter sp. UB-Tiil-W10 TaxID=1855648 RepID=UPI0021037483|nr:SURF1 family protein [Polynucleobacter sp. UB-Tiil-W10]
MNSLFTALIAKRIVATVSALLVVAIGCSAGIWQLSRAETKIALAANLLARQKMPILSANAGPLTLEEASERRMIARGQYIPESAIWLDNRPRPIPPGGSTTAQSGFYLMMPLRLEGKDGILWVNRGWAPRNNENRETLPPVQTPNKVVNIEGIVFAHPGRVFELGSKKIAEAVSGPRIEQNFDLTAEGKLHSWNQAPFILREVEVGTEDGLLRDWAPLTSGVDRHYAYAFQWFALAFAGFLFWLVTGLRQFKRRGFVNGDQG